VRVARVFVQRVRQHVRVRLTRIGVEDQIQLDAVFIANDRDLVAFGLVQQLESQEPVEIERAVKIAHANVTARRRRGSCRRSDEPRARIRSPVIRVRSPLLRDYNDQRGSLEAQRARGLFVQYRLSDPRIARLLAMADEVLATAAPGLDACGNYLG
jgi:hypothetical protein